MKQHQWWEGGRDGSSRPIVDKGLGLDSLVQPTLLVRADLEYRRTMQPRKPLAIMGVIGPQGEMWARALVRTCARGLVRLFSAVYHHLPQARRRQTTETHSENSAP